jgi:hypothetical protein
MTSPSNFSRALSQWQLNFTQVGKIHGELIRSYQQNPNNPFDQDLAATYYDPIEAFVRGARFTGDSAWLEIAKAASQIYSSTSSLTKDAFPDTGYLPTA